MMKRAFDVLASALGLLVLAPLFAVVAVVIRLDSPGDVLFRQVRIGRNFKPFTILKFRTMVADAEARGGQITLGDEPRITRAGRLLRRLKIDEFPQLWNVLRGDMSLVGSRPEVPRYVELYRADFKAVLAARPGITDPASIRFSNESELLGASADPEREYREKILPAKLALSKDYARRSSLSSDVALILRTLLKISA